MGPAPHRCQGIFVGRQVDGKLLKREAGAPMACRKGPVEPPATDSTLQTHGKDKYGRILADVFLPDGMNVNHELVKDGWCWWYRKYAPGDVELERLEIEAREAKKGLWQDSAFIPPWVYRKAKRGHALNLSDLVPLE